MIKTQKQTKELICEAVNNAASRLGLKTGFKIDHSVKVSCLVFESN